MICSFPVLCSLVLAVAVLGCGFLREVQVQSQVLCEIGKVVEQKTFALQMSCLIHIVLMSNNLACFVPRLTCDNFLISCLIWLDFLLDFVLNFLICLVDFR